MVCLFLREYSISLVFSMDVVRHQMDVHVIDILLAVRSSIDHYPESALWCSCFRAGYRDSLFPGQFGYQCHHFTQ